MVLCGSYRTISGSPLLCRFRKSNTGCQQVHLLIEPSHWPRRWVFCVNCYLCRSIQYHMFTKSPCSGFVSPQHLGTISSQELCWSLEVQRFCSPRNATWQAGQETHTSVEPPPRHQRADRIVQCSHWHSSPLNKCVEIKSTHRITHTFKVQYGWGYMFTRHAASAAFILRTFHHPHRRHAATRSRLPFPSTFLGHPRSSVLPKSICSEHFIHRVRMAHCTVFHDCLLTGNTILKARQYVEHILPFCIAEAFPVMWPRHVFS